MALILRVDVDKPYGNKTLVRQIASKMVEDFWFPGFIMKNRYLKHNEELLRFCNDAGVSGFFYHRLCTIPDDKTMKLLKEGNHKLGFHAENTRSYETFLKELNIFKMKVAPFPVESFSKHGSGVHKLGKHHYAPYEPDKYREWAKKAETGFYFGNDIAKSESDLNAVEGFFPNIFWMERDYRSPSFSDYRKAADEAVNKDVVILIHPCNYEANEDVANDFKGLVEYTANNHIKWKVY